MKKEIKKLLAMMLSIMMLFTLAACGKKQEDPEPEPVPDGGDEPAA